MTASNCEYDRCRLTVAAQVSKPTSSAASRPAELGESAIRQVWKSALNKIRLRRVAQLRDSQFAPCQHEKRGALRRGYF